MDTSTDDKACSFCGVPGPEGPRFAGGLGAMICVECVSHFHDVFSTPEKTEAALQAPWETMTDAEILSKLPLIERNAQQVQHFLTEWVELARSRTLSWAQIGKAMGTTRQSAWERFAQRVERLRAQRSA